MSIDFEAIRAELEAGRREEAARRKAEAAEIREASRFFPNEIVPTLKRMRWLMQHKAPSK